MSCGIQENGTGQIPLNSVNKHDAHQILNINDAANYLLFSTLSISRSENVSTEYSVKWIGEGTSTL